MRGTIMTVNPSMGTTRRSAPWRFSVCSRGASCILQITAVLGNGCFENMKNVVGSRAEVNPNVLF